MQRLMVMIMNSFTFFMLLMESITDAIMLAFSASDPTLIFGSDITLVKKSMPLTKALRG
jgi:hypothetical protein